MVHRGFRLNLMPLLLVTALALGGAMLAACGGDDDGAPTDVATTAPGGSPADAAGASPTAAATLPEITSLCDVVTPGDVKEVLGESVTGASEFKDVSCGYSTAAGGVNIERGSQQDFEVGVFRTGELGEPVAGIGDEAAWFVGGLNILSVRQGDFYFQIRLNVPGVDIATQLEIAKGLATRGVERIP